MKRNFLITALFIIPLVTLSCDLTGTPKITVKGAKFVPSIVERAPAAVFMLIINDGSGADKLTGCSLREYPSARGELHDVIDRKMQKVEFINIPSREITVLKRGSFHLMFFDIPEKLNDEVTLLLQFKKSGLIEVKAPVGHFTGDS